MERGSLQLGGERNAGVVILADVAGGWLRKTTSPGHRRRDTGAVRHLEAPGVLFMPLPGGASAVFSATPQSK